MSALPGRATAQRLAVGFAVIVLAFLALGVAFLLVTRLLPHRDSAPPIVTARKDERAAASAATQIGTDTAAANRDTTINLDLTTKEIRDAFDAPQPVPPAVAGQPALPPAPVDRLRDRLNESIARANRAADAAGPAD